MTGRWMRFLILGLIALACYRYFTRKKAFNLTEWVNATAIALLIVATLALISTFGLSLVP